MSEISTKPYLLRALYEWCTDNGYTPYLAVSVDERTQVPRDFVKDGEIILNVSPMATNQLTIGNEWIEFQARFGGVSRELAIPVDMVSAIYARENGHGMAFDINKLYAPAVDSSASLATKPGSSAKRSHLSAVSTLNAAQSDMVPEAVDTSEKASLKLPRKERKRTEPTQEKVLSTDQENPTLIPLSSSEDKPEIQPDNVSKSDAQSIPHQSDRKKPTLTIIK